MAKYKVPVPGGYGDERKLGWYFDALAAEDAQLVRRLWADNENLYRAIMDPLHPNDSNSANKPPLAIELVYLEDPASAAPLLHEYLDRQLDPENLNYHFFGHKEQMSSLYTWPWFGALPVLAQTRDSELAEKLIRFLRAYVFVLCLAALPRGYGQMPTVVWMAGARTPAKWLGNEQLAYLLRMTLGMRTPMPRQWYRNADHALWPARLAWTYQRVLKKIFSEAERRRLRNHVQNGGQAAWIAEHLERLRVRFRVPMRYIRTKQGGLSVMYGNQHPSTPPIPAAAVIGNSFHDGSPWPAGHRGEGGRTIGKVNVRVEEGRRVEVSVTGSMYVGQPRGNVVGNALTSAVPIPGGKVLFDLTIGPNGVTSVPDQPEEAKDSPFVSTLRQPVTSISRLYGLLETGGDPSRILPQIRTSANNIRNQLRDA